MRVDAVVVQCNGELTGRMEQVAGGSGYVYRGNELWRRPVERQRVWCA